MKLALCIGLAAALIGTQYRFHSSQLAAANDNVLDYQIQGQKYAVVVIQEGGMSEMDARNLAVKRAAEITVEHGNRYFVIDSESKTQVVQSENAADPFYGNLYQEKIIEKDFGKDQISKQNSPTADIVPGLRIVFVMYQDKPSFRAIDACRYADCRGWQ